MAGRIDYDHIKVTADEDDEVVIFAGATSTHPHASQADALTDPLPLNATSAEHASAVYQERVEGSHQGRPIADKAAGSQERAVDRTGSFSTEDGEGYHATTLEDIKSSKMSSTQLIVIGLALIAIASFALWCIFFQG